MKHFLTLLFVLCAWSFNMAAQTPTLAPIPELGVVQADSLGYWLTAPSAWTVQPTTDFVVVIDENFQDWTLNHDKTNVSESTKGRAAAASYADWSQPITIKGGASAGQAATIKLLKCAVAPQGLSQNKIEFTKPASDIFKGNNSDYSKGQIADPSDGDALSPGFLEISRWNTNGTNADGADLTTTAYNGSITLPAIQGAMVIQYSYSSIGGSKRALKLERSIDGGANWETIRNPMKNTVQFAEKDAAVKVTFPSGADDTPTEYDKFKSAYFCSGAGVYLEDYIGDGEETVTLRLTVNDCWKDDASRDAVNHADGHAETQDYRLHDIRVIAFGGAIGGTNTMQADAFAVLPHIDYISTSVEADIQLYSMNGTLVREVKNSLRMGTRELPQGLYIVKATADNKHTVVRKYVVR